MITPEQTGDRSKRACGIVHLLPWATPGMLSSLALLLLPALLVWVCPAADPDPGAEPESLVVRLIPKGDTWRYLDDGSDQGEAWRAPKFDAAAWRAAPAELGYGDHNEATAIQYGPDSKHKHITSYFRRSFDVPDPAKFKGLRAGLLCDDGAVVYLNGKEVVRRNMPKGPIAATTLAAKQIGGNEETRYSGHDLPVALLTPGANVIAVEVHQGNPASSDLSFDFELVAADEKDVELALLAMHRRNVNEDRDFVRANLPKPEGAATSTWPAFMRDRSRSGVSAATLPLPLQPVWTHLPDHPPNPAWYAPATRPREGFTLLNRMAFDDACQVTISGGSVFFGSSATDCIVSLDVKTGQRNWLFSTGGPVRLAPTIWQGKLYAGSDDGFVYCLTAKDGKVVWKHRAGPRDERLLGNGRLISRWPVRTDVLIHEGIAYFGAGVFPHEGTLLQALDAENGNVIWRNDTLGQTNANRDPVTPQGYLLASDDLLFVPSGRAMPAAFSRKDGSFVYQKSYSWRGTQGCGPTGGVYALLAKGQLYTGTSQLLALDQRRGGTGFGWFKGRRMVVSGDMAFMANGTEIVSMRLDPYAQMTRRTPEFQKTISGGEYRYAVSRQERSRKRRAVAEAERQMARIDHEIATAQKQGAKGAAAAKALALRRAGFEKAAEDAQQRVDELDPIVADEKAKLNAVKREKQRHRTRSEKATLLWRQSSTCVDAMVLAGNALIAGGKDKIMAMDPVSGDVLWSSTVQGTVRGLAVVPGYLLASTTKGHIYCFGTAAAGAPRADVSATPATRKLEPSDPATSSHAQAAERILKLTGRRRGWALVLGTDGGRLARELAVRSELNLVVVEPDAARAAAAEQYLRAERLYGARAVVHTLSLAADLPYPNYFADLVVAAAPPTAGMFPQGAGHLARHVKPHGGTVCFAPASGQGITAEKLRAQVQQLVPGEAKVTEADGRTWCVATRGALPGAGNWTHQYANPGNTGASED
ncbi:MAG: PQQ-like beta-propeller repeat protein, partial [Victivallales bacterium]|nr:PQQ-like beta-propeller repeat protein [Victivallales bacterium]